MTATHNVKAYRNSMEQSAGKAPFLGRYLPNETLPFEALCEQVAGYSGQTAIQVRAILEGSFDAIAELEKDGLAIVHLDGMSVCAVIKGSFPTGDAAFDPERNSLELAIRLDDSVRLALAGVTPRMVTDDDLPKVRVDNVKDIEVERPTDIIHGRRVFRVAGHKLILSDAGARVYIKGKDGVEHEVVVDEAQTDQLFTAHVAELLEGGDYTLWVESRAGVVDGPLQRDGCRVKYLGVEDPPAAPDITDAYSENSEVEHTDIDGNSAFIIQGEHLQGASVAFQYKNDGVWSDPSSPTEEDMDREEGEIHVHQDWLGSLLGDDDWDLGEGDEVKITVTNSAGSDSVIRTVVYS